MRFSRSLSSGIAGILALIVLIALWMLITDERCSRNVSNMDITFEEVVK